MRYKTRKNIAIYNCYFAAIVSAGTISFSIMTSNYNGIPFSIGLIGIAIFSLTVLIPQVFKDLPVYSVNAILFGGPHDGKLLTLKQPMEYIEMADLSDFGDAVVMKEDSAEIRNKTFTKHIYRFSAMDNERVAFYKYLGD